MFRRCFRYVGLCVLGLAMLMVACQNPATFSLGNPAAFCSATTPCPTGKICWYSLCRYPASIPTDAGHPDNAPPAERQTPKDEQVGVCGNGICEHANGEHCENCPNDCNCPEGRLCQPGGGCGVACGNGSCENNLGENCRTCNKDCACNVGAICNQVASCCERQCGNKECGNDGCGGQCGSCAAGAQCQNGQCSCVSNCSAGAALCKDNKTLQRCKEGPAGCFRWEDVLCAANQSCVSGQTECCAPNCNGKTCGDDGCGDSCGACNAPETCQAGTCKAPEKSYTIRIKRFQVPCANSTCFDTSSPFKVDPFVCFQSSPGDSACGMGKTSPVVDTCNRPIDTKDQNGASILLTYTATQISSGTNIEIRDDDGGSFQTCCTFALSTLFSSGTGTQQSASGFCFLNVEIVTPYP
ncbi:MAG TPA: hypothetical protein DCE42_06135 [Myxococcales bacterium]|nr:hypothetical protein [Myxococcales bacterium]